MKQVLSTNNVDDILSDAMGGKRRFNLIPNEDGTYSLEDVSTYDQIGTPFGALNVNATNNAVNESADKNKVIDDLDIIKATTEAGYMAGALAVKELTNSLRIKTFTDISQFGCTSTFLPDIVVAMPQHSYLIRHITSTDKSIGENADNRLPYASGVMTIEKTTSYVRVLFNGANSGGSNGSIYLANININTKELNGWYQFNGTVVS